MSPAEPSSDQIARFADRLSAMGTEPRLRIMRVLLTAHPSGMVVSDIQAELGVPGSSLSHHLEKLKNEDLVTVKREGTYLRYAANVAGLHELLTFLFAECCTRNQVVSLSSIMTLGGNACCSAVPACVAPAATDSAAN